MNEKARMLDLDNDNITDNDTDVIDISSNNEDLPVNVLDIKPAKKSQTQAWH